MRESGQTAVEPGRETADGSTARKTVFAAAFGFFVDMYDVNLPAVALAPAMSYFIPDTMSAGAKAITLAFVFVATLVGRPIGSIVFGHLSDRVGRRKVTIVSVSGCAIATLVMACLPGYERLGVAGAVILIALRFIAGMFMGGEYTGATPLAMEAAPRERRGLFGGIVGAGSALANCAIAVVTFLCLQLAPEGGPEAPYTVWGWRISFIVGAVLCGVFLIYFSRQIEESETWKEAPKAKNPLAEVLFGRGRHDLIQIFIMMTGVWLATGMASGLLPSALANESMLTATQVTGALVIAQAVHAVFFPLIGAMGDRFGRRPLLIWNGVAIAVICSGAFALLGSSHGHGFVGVLVVALLVRVAGGSIFAVIPSYLCERFPPATRGTGFGIGYSAPLLITSFYAYYQEWLGSIIPMQLTPVILLLVAGVLIVVASAAGPETRGSDLTVDPTTARTF